METQLGDPEKLLERTEMATEELIEMEVTDSIQTQDIPKFRMESKETCSICLAEFQNKSFLMDCFHSFCFECIRTWSRTSNCCPLCKAPNSEIIHSIDDSKHFLLYNIERNGSSGDIRETYDHRSDTRRERTRNWRNYRSNCRRDRRHDWGTREEQDYADRWQENQRKRRLVYDTQKRAKYAAPHSNSKLFSLSPSYLRLNSEKLLLLHDWMRLELSVILNDFGVELVRDYILGVMKVHDIQSQEAIDMLKEYLGENTQLFVHELVCFSKSSLSVDDYLKYAQY